MRMVFLYAQNAHMFCISIYIFNIIQCQKLYRIRDKFVKGIFLPNIQNQNQIFIFI